MKQYEMLLTQIFGDVSGKALWEVGSIIEDTVAREVWFQKLTESMRVGDFSELSKDERTYNQPVVSVEEFVCDDYFLGKKGVVYPEVLKAAVEMNNGSYIEAVLTGGIGSAKTTLAHYSMAYQLYVLSCLRNPHELFNLDPASEIAMVLQSLNATVAKNVEYNRFRSLCEGSYYFREVWPFNPAILSKMVFKNRIEIYSVSGAESAAIGQNIIGGILDEVNYMSIVEKSKSNVDGGEYDQAWALYNSIARRRKSRFVVKGVTYGMLCLVSSKRFPGQFTDVKTAEANTQIAKTGKSNIFVYDKRVWDVKPEGTYDIKTFFPVFIGTDNRQPAILTEEEAVAFMKAGYADSIIRVPGDYLVEFQKDIINALREVAGVSTLALQPYFTLVDKVSAAFGKTPHVLNLESVVLTKDTLKILKQNIQNKNEPRYAHIDLSLTGDSTGLCVGHVRGFKELSRGSDLIELLPEIVMDCVLEIKPPPFGEIEYAKVRNIIYALVKAGVPIKWVSFDSYQSADSMQVLRSRGFTTGLLSMDTSLVPYALLKAALYDYRVMVPTHKRLELELKSLEYDSKKGKVDHTSISTKDVSDAFAGVVYGLTMRREIWSRHKIPVSRIPESIKAEAAKVKLKQAEVETQ